MIFLGEPPVGGLDDLVLSLGIDLEDLVRIRARPRTLPPRQRRRPIRLRQVRVGRHGSSRSPRRDWQAARRPDETAYRNTSRAAAAIGRARIAPSSPAIAPPTTSANMTALGCSSTASPWIFGTSRLFSTCWMTYRGRAPPSPRRARQSVPSNTAGIAAMIGPMIGRSSRTPAMTDSRSANRPNTGSMVSLRSISPTNVATPTVTPRKTWPRSHWPNTRSAMPATARASARHSAGIDRSAAPASAGRSLIR